MEEEAQRVGLSPSYVLPTGSNSKDQGQLGHCSRTGRTEFCCCDDEVKITEICYGSLCPYNLQPLFPLPVPSRAPVPGAEGDRGMGARQGHQHNAVAPAADELPLPLCWKPSGLQGGWADPDLSTARSRLPSADGALCAWRWHTVCAACLPAVIWANVVFVFLPPSPLGHPAECACAPSVVLERRRAEELGESWVSLKQGGMETQEPHY